MLKKSGKVLLSLLLAGIVGTLLSSCHINQKDPADIPTFISTDDKLRIYQQFDTIYYRMEVNSAATTEFGTLQIAYENVAITEPLTPISLPVLKETTILTMNNGDMDALVRYLDQDDTTGSPNYGSLSLHAFDTPNINEYYWLSETLPPTSVIQKFELFRSPLAMAGEIDLGPYYVAGTCGAGAICNDSFAFAQSRTFEVTATNQTVDIPGTGVFKNVYRVQLNASTTLEATAPLLDIFDLCGAAGELTSHQTILFIVPEIGVIKSSNTCTNQSGETVIYTANMDRTSFQYQF